MSTSLLLETENCEVHTDSQAPTVCLTFMQAVCI